MPINDAQIALELYSALERALKSNCLELEHQLSEFERLGWYDEERMEMYCTCENEIRTSMLQALTCVRTYTV